MVLAIVVYFVLEVGEHYSKLEYVCSGLSSIIVHGVVCSCVFYQFSCYRFGEHYSEMKYFCSGLLSEFSTWYFL